MRIVLWKAVVPFGAITMVAVIAAGCRWLNDDGSQFASETAEFAQTFRASNQVSAVFEYTPIRGNDQRIAVEIDRIRYCPRPPCDNQGAATVRVERGESGTGYRIAAAANVPEPLTIQKERGPVRVHMRKNAAGEVDIVRLE